MFLETADVLVENYVELFWYLLQDHQKETRNLPRVDSASNVKVLSNSSSLKIPVRRLSKISVEKPSSPTPVEPNPTAPPLFALTIGINKYNCPEFTVLSGAVNDADSVEEYLKEDLSVPPSHIRSLRDEAATRAAIIQGFMDLRSDERIKRGDPILLFYAGHGAETDVNGGKGKEGEKIQMIVPCDYGEGEDGVDGIPDRTINALLEGLAREKGDNITVIFDCCHSGSGTRKGAPEDHTRVNRSATLMKDVPSHLDNDILAGARGGRLSKGFLQKGLRSHVLMAACGQAQQAVDDRIHKRGVFTHALVTALKTIGADRLTYTEVLQRMERLPMQDPQCEGFHQDRIFFHSKAPSAGRVFYNVHLDEKGSVIIEAGSAHGITSGTEFAIHSSQDFKDDSLLGTLVVTEVEPFSCSARFPLGTDKNNLLEKGPAFALETKAGKQADFRIHVPLDKAFLCVFDAIALEMKYIDPEHGKIVVVEKKQNPDLEVALEGGGIVFNILDHRITRYGLTRMPYSVAADVQEVYPVMRAAAHYYWHLNRTSLIPALEGQLHVEFTRLEKASVDINFQPVLGPTGPNLNLFGVIDLVADGRFKYGMKITNDSPFDLYPSIFLFDNSDFSIDPYYLPSTSGQRLDAPLPKRGGSLTVGYGSGGAAPFTFQVRDNQNVDVGFFKFFLTTQPVRYNNVPQPSPFASKRGMVRSRRETLSIFATMTLPVVQRRKLSTFDRGIHNKEVLPSSFPSYPSFHGGAVAPARIPDINHASWLP